MKTWPDKSIKLRRPLTLAGIASLALASVSASTMRQVHLGTNFRIDVPSASVAEVRETKIASAPKNAAILCARRSDVAGVFQQSTTTSLIIEISVPIGFRSASVRLCMQYARPVIVSAKDALLWFESASDGLLW